MLHAGLRDDTFALFIHKSIQKKQFNSLAHLVKKNYAYFDKPMN